ncbi:MAG: deoxynucleoside kinase [Terriglobia bacterium]
MASTPRFSPPRYIAIEGPIRVGKSTLARILADRLHARRLFDPEDNPHLKDFYEARAGAGFRAQMWFLLTRYRQLRELAREHDPRTLVTDYLFEKDKLFACINLNDDELKLYDLYYDWFRAQLPVPDLVIYLQANLGVLKKRIAKRRDPRERQLADDYLAEVIRAYEHFFFHYSASNLLVVDTSQIDFVERHDDLQKLLHRLSEPIKGTQYFLPLGPAP